MTTHTRHPRSQTDQSTTDTDTETNTETQPDTRPLLEATNVAVSYGDVEVLESVSATIDRGTVTALIGPNGTGKTTLLCTLAGLSAPTGGTVEYLGPETSRQIGYLPQRPSFRPGFTVLETLEFYASLVGEDREKALERLELVGLEAAAGRQVEALSGGMTRLVGIAQATIGDPPVIVLDEPASGLDPGMRGHVFDIAGELAASGTAVLLSSHDLGLVERTADHVLLLDDGTICRRGSPATLQETLEVDSLRAVYEQSIAGDLHTVSVRGERS